MKKFITFIVSMVLFFVCLHGVVGAIAEIDRSMPKTTHDKNTKTIENTKTINRSLFVEVETVKLKDGNIDTISILVDKETGVQYLFDEDYHGKGYFMTPRYGADGKPLMYDLSLLPKESEKK